MTVVGEGSATGVERQAGTTPGKRCFVSRPHLQCMEVPRLGVELELQLPAHTTATATQDPSCVCDLHHSSRQHQIVSPLSEARDRTCNLMVPTLICFCCARTGTPDSGSLNKKVI